MINTKILIIGFGSIGKKHYNNLLKLGFENVWIFDIDKEKTKDAGLKVLENFNNLQEFDVALVCNPTHLHIKTAIECAKAGCDLFIEKPLSSDFDNIDKLSKICEDKGIISMIGCNLRFEEAVFKIKELLNNQFLGKIYNIYLEYGRYLPYQRQGVDYRKVYAANKSMGGGIILDDIHDFDLLFWFNNFSKIKKSFFVFDKLSNLDIDVEDSCNALFVFDNGVIGAVRCDYLQKYKHRNIKIVGEKGNLRWDFRENVLWFEYFDEKFQKEKKEKLFEKNNAGESPYLRELVYFLDCVQTRKQPFNDIRRAQETLKIILQK